MITRVQAKLTGRDFATSPSDEEEDLTVEQQVDRYATFFIKLHGRRDGSGREHTGSTDGCLKSGILDYRGI